MNARSPARRTRPRARWSPGGAGARGSSARTSPDCASCARERDELLALHCALEPRRSSRRARLHRRSHARARRRRPGRRAHGSPGGWPFAMLLALGGAAARSSRRRRGRASSPRRRLVRRLRRRSHACSRAPLLAGAGLLGASWRGLGFGLARLAGRFEAPPGGRRGAAVGAEPAASCACFARRTSRRNGRRVAAAIADRLAA